MSGSWRKIGYVVALVGLAIAAYWPALHGTWLWDDGLEVAANPMVRSSDGWWRSWVRPEGMDYFPVKEMVQWAEWHLWGRATLGYHLVNVWLHAMAALLTWRLLSRLGIASAWLGGALFAIHPMAVESVAWIAEMKTELSAVFLLLATIAYIDSEERDSSRLYGVSLACFILGLLSKSTIVMLPVALLVWTLWANKPIGKRALARLSPFFLASLAIGLITISFQGNRAIGAGGPMPPFMERVGQAGWSLMAYLREAVLPIDLAPIYGPIAPALPLWLPWLAFGCAAAALWAVSGKSRRHVAFALIVFVVLLLPVVGVLKMSYLRVAPRADHLAYLAMLPASGAIAALVGLLLQSGSVMRRRVGAAISALLLAGCFVLTRAQAALFSSPRALWTAAAERRPDAWVAQANLGKELLDEMDATGAAAALGKAVQLQPDSAEVFLDLANADKALDHTAAAELGYRRALELDPNLAGAHFDFGLLLVEEGKASEAAVQLREALRRDPGHVGAHNELGVALGRLGEAAEARAQFEQAIALDPRNREARLNLGNWFARSGEPKQAIEQYRISLSIDPSYAAAAANLKAVENAYRLTDSPRP